MNEHLNEEYVNQTVKPKPIEMKIEQKLKQF